MNGTVVVRKPWNGEVTSVIDTKVPAQGLVFSRHEDALLVVATDDGITVYHALSGACVTGTDGRTRRRRETDDGAPLSACSHQVFTLTLSLMCAAAYADVAAMRLASGLGYSPRQPTRRVGVPFPRREQAVLLRALKVRPRPRLRHEVGLSVR